MSGRSVILIGATGLVGSQVLNMLLEDSTITSVCAPTRRPIGVTHAKLKNPVFSFDEFDLHTDQLDNADELFFCFGTTLKTAGSKAAFVRLELDLSERIILVCIKKGIKRLFMVSSASASKDSPIFYSRIKGQLEDFAKALVNEGKLAELVVLRPSLLLGERAESRPGEAFFRTVLKPFLFAFVGPLKSSKPVWDWQVAKTLIKASVESAKDKVRLIPNEVICEESR